MNMKQLQDSLLDFLVEDAPDAAGSDPVELYRQWRKSRFGPPLSDSRILSDPLTVRSILEYLERLRHKDREQLKYITTRSVRGSAMYEPGG